MPILSIWRVPCITEDAYVDTYGYQEEVPTVCPHNEAHTIDADNIVAIESMDTDIQDVNTHGLEDLTGNDYYQPPFTYIVQAGEHNIFMDKFDSSLFLMGGGYAVPREVYLPESPDMLITQRPAHGDKVSLDIVDIDNVLGYGITAEISKVERYANVVTITTVEAHGIPTGYPVCVDVDGDDTFDAPEVSIASVPTTTTFTFAQTGDNVEEKSETGDVGVVVNLGCFLPGSPIWPGREWELFTRDGKTIYSGLYIRFHYFSYGNQDLCVYSWYNMRKV